jgi:hypothetical protein
MAKPETRYSLSLMFSLISQTANRITLLPREVVEVVYFGGLQVLHKNKY